METVQTNTQIPNIQPPQITTAKNNNYFFIIGGLILLSIILVTTIYYLLTRKNQIITSPRLLTQNMKVPVISPIVLVKGENRTINRPLREDILSALNSAENTTSITLFLNEKIVDFIIPFFYPPNGYAYDNIKAVYTYSADLTEKKSHPINDTFVYLHITGKTGIFSDEYLVGIGLNPDKKTVKTISLNSPPMGVPIDLRDKLTQRLKEIPVIKNFTDKYSISSGAFAFYRPEIKSSDYRNVTISFYDIAPENNYILVRFRQPGGGIPENPRKEIDAVIDPTTLLLIKIKEY